jgi:hypothetical protein
MKAIDHRRMRMSGPPVIGCGVIYSVVFALSLVVLSPCQAADDKTGLWVEAEGFYHLGDETTMELAQRASLEAARRAAIEKALGMHVTGSTLVRNAQLVEDLVHVVARGMIVEERILEQGLKADGAKGAHATYRTRIKAKVVRLTDGQRASNFSARCRLNRSTYQHGDHAELRVTPSQDSYVYAFDVTEDEHITVLVPNRYLPEARVQAGTEFVFPPPDLVKRGILLTTMVVPGKHRSAESIKVIATRQPMEALKRRAPEALFDEYRPNDTTLLVDLLKTLAGLDAGEWAECSTTYDIVREN